MKVFIEHSLNNEADKFAVTAVAVGKAYTENRKKSLKVGLPQFKSQLGEPQPLVQAVQHLASVEIQRGIKEQKLGRVLRHGTSTVLCFAFMEMDKGNGEANGEINGEINIKTRYVPLHSDFQVKPVEGAFERMPVLTLLYRYAVNDNSLPELNAAEQLLSTVMNLNQSGKIPKGLSAIMPVLSNTSKPNTSKPVDMWICRQGGKFFTVIRQQIQNKGGRNGIRNHGSYHSCNGSNIRRRHLPFLPKVQQKEAPKGKGTAGCKRAGQHRAECFNVRIRLRAFRHS